MSDEQRRDDPPERSPAERSLAERSPAERSPAERLPAERLPAERSLAAIVARVRETIARYGLLADGDRVLVACSGGPDSVALLAVLDRLRRGGMALELTVGHVDHGLRPDSARDAAAVADLARSLGLPFVQRKLALGKADVGGGGGVSEDVARQGRLAALRSMAEEVGAGRVALGHQADDQVETLIMRLCRGAGLTGLAGMAPRRGIFVRPLLALGRAEVLEILAAAGWAAREDPTNRDRRFLRNRVRQEVVPLLQQENPRLAEAITRTALGVREELEALARYEEVEAGRLAVAHPLGEAVDAAGLAGLPRGMATRLVRRLWRGAREGVIAAEGEVRAPAELGRDAVEAVLALLGRDTGPRVTLPGGVVAFRQYDLLVVAAASRLADPGDVAVQVPGPGVYRLPGLGLEVEAGCESTERPGWPLQVRNLRPGDRITGAAGSRKVSDLLVDRKIPRARRRRLAVVVWAGEILWIPGVWQGSGVVVEPGSLRATLPGPGVALEVRETGLDGPT